MFSMNEVNKTSFDLNLGMVSTLLPPTLQKTIGLYLPKSEATISLLLPLTP